MPVYHVVSISLAAIKLSNTWLGSRDLLETDPELLRELEEATIRLANAFEAQALSNILNAMAILAGPDWQPSEHVLEVLCQECLEVSDTFSAQGISNALNALSKLNHHPGDRLLQELCLEAVRHAPEFSSQAIPNLLNAVVSFDYNPGENVLHVMTDEALKKLTNFNPQGIANYLNAVSKLNYHPGEVFLRTIMEQARKNIHQFLPQALSSTLNALARLDFYPGEVVMQAFCDEAIKKEYDFTSQGLANILNAVARLHFYPGDRFLEHMSSMCTRIEMENQGVSNVLNAFAKLNYRPSRKVLDKMCELVVELKDASTPQSITNTLQALVLLDHVTPAVFSSLLPLLPPDGAGLDPESFVQVYNVDMSLRLLYSHLRLDVPARLSDICIQHTTALQRSVNSSTLHLAISKAISKVLTEELHLPHKNEDVGSGLSLDITLPDQKVAIEVDGPFHFALDAQGNSHYLGTTVHKHRLLHKMGWRVVSLPYYEWNALPSHSERAPFLRRKLLEVGADLS
eukprot:g29927.t1